MTTVISGSVVEKEATFRDTDGALANPNTVTATAKKPDDTTEAGTVINTGTGTYDILFDTDQAGLWYYRIVGEGNSTDVIVEGSFCVKASSVV